MISSIILALVILFVAAALYVRSRVRFWLGHAQHMQESGYLVPPSTWVAKLTYRVVTRLAVYLMVGPLQVTGRENLNVEGRKIFVPNHQFELDFAMAAAAARTACPIMTSTGVLGENKLYALFGAWTGSIPVNVHEGRGGKKAYDASVQTLLRSLGAEFIIFPQGGLMDELRLRDFKPGAARMQCEVFSSTEGEPVWLVPIYIDYVGCHFHKPLSHHLLGRLRRMFGQTNYGGFVRIGQPIAHEAGRSASTTTALAFDSIKSMRDEAKSTGKFHRD